MTEKQRAAILDAVRAAKRSEFKVTAIKVELEAQLRRHGDFSNTSYCHDYIMERLAVLGLAENSEEDWHSLSHDVETEWQTAGALQYAEFYNDGSVDSEFTFTISLAEPENIFLLPKVIEIFNELATANGAGVDVDGAGMHMAFLNDPHCNYPAYTTTTEEHHRRLGNFSRSMSMLLPAMYFLGTSSERSRGMSYRRPQVGYDTHRAAIDYRGGALEFRVFDTCYDTPNAILDNFVVMSKAIRYWRLKHLPSGLEKIATRTRFGNDEGYELNRLYVTHEHLALLNEGLLRLKPSYYTIKQIKLQRKFEKNKRFLDKERIAQTKQAEVEFQEYEERFAWQLQVLRSRTMLRMAEGVGTFGEQAPVSAAEAQSYLETQADIRLATERPIKKSIKRYVREKLAQLDEAQGDYTLSVS